MGKRDRIVVTSDMVREAILGKGEQIPVHLSPIVVSRLAERLTAVLNPPTWKAVRTSMGHWQVAGPRARIRLMDENGNMFRNPDDIARSKLACERIAEILNRVEFDLPLDKPAGSKSDLGRSIYTT